ncbi:MAG: pyrroloquinoline-quinone synthase [Thermoleophilaceae bacterium]|nr:pyrroloquinoline-quinone synthase [Thermoleophilaceae bacterium]
MDFWSRLESTADRWNVLRHPFYVRWSNGELSGDELCFYAGQYGHAVGALATATRSAADSADGAAARELAQHAAEEEAHVDLWSEFASAVGAKDSAEPLPETTECVSAWGDESRELLPTLVALYAIESAQPAISETKRAGLVEHYGMKPRSRGTAYFDLHTVRDHEHANSGRAMIAERLDGADADALVAEAERVLEANWRLLDGVEEARAA